MLRKPIPQTLAIHDLSSWGRSSLTVIIPILTRMGIQTCPVPTAVLSTHTAYEDPAIVDLTSQMQDTLNHWKNLNLEFDAIYSGYLGSADQISIVQSYIDTYKKEKTIVMVDPVLGDDGELYGPLGDDLVNGMKRLVKSADIITPNLTEAALLLDEVYSTDLKYSQIKEWMLRLAEFGPKVVIMTSVPVENKPDQTSVIAYDKKMKRFWRVKCHYIPACYPGTGDSFSSVVLGSLLTGDSLPIALDRAVQFNSMAIRATFGHYSDNREGINLESSLKHIDAPVTLNSFEIWGDE